MCWVNLFGRLTYEKEITCSRLIGRGEKRFGNVFRHIVLVEDWWKRKEDEIVDEI